MRTVLTIATALGVLGVLETFLLFALAHKVFGLDQDMVRTLIYLKLSVSGHLTVFVTRTRGPSGRAAPVPAPARRGHRHPGAGDTDRRLRPAHDSARLGLGRGGLGLPLFWFLVEDRTKLYSPSGSSRMLPRRPAPSLST